MYSREGQIANVPPDGRRAQPERLASGDEDSEGGTEQCQGTTAESRLPFVIDPATLIGMPLMMMVVMGFIIQFSSRCTQYMLHSIILVIGLTSHHIISMHCLILNEAPEAFLRLLSAGGRWSGTR